MERVLIFANPIAGRGRGVRLARNLQSALADAGLGAHLELRRITEVDLAALRPAEARAAVVIGGDGTLRGIARALLRQCSGQAPPILVVPMGTANLMARHLGIQWTPDTPASEVTRAIVRGRTAALDAAEGNGQLFLLMAGIGLDASVVHELDRVRRGPINRLSYALPALRAAANYSYPPIAVEVDGQRIFGPRPGIAFVGNVKEYGTGFAVLPQARSDDGLLDVCALPCAGRLQVAKLVLHALSGRHMNVQGAAYVKGTRVRVTAPVPVPVQLDGDAAGFTPLTAHLLPTRVRFVVP